MTNNQGGTQEGVGVNHPLELDILQNLYYLCKGNQMFSHTFFLLICTYHGINLHENFKEDCKWAKK